MKALATSKAATPAVRVLTAQQEAFAQHYATYGDPRAAIRHAYNIQTTRVATVQQMAWRALHHPAVAARITALRNASAADELASRERLIADLEAMVNVDTNELMQLRVVPCPHCWPTPDAWESAAAAALDAAQEPPSADEPNPRCVVCVGAGRNVGQLMSTADLSLPARRMFKGLEFFPDGGIKRVLLHDAAQLRVELHKLKGMHVERSVSLNLNADVKPLRRDMTLDEVVAAWETISPTDEQPAPNDSDVVSEQ